MGLIADTLLLCTKFATGEERTLPTVEFGPSAGSTLFFVHPAGGTVHRLAALAARLRPLVGIVALEAPGFDAGTVPCSTMDALVSAHTADIRSHQSEGPYLLGGVSMGATVAFEIARRLLTSGAAVALLALVDAPPDLAILGGGGEWTPFALLREHFPSLDIEDWRRIAHLPLGMQVSTLVFGGVTSTDREGVVPEYVERVGGVHRAHWQLASGYVPTPCQVEATIYRTTQWTVLPAAQEMFYAADLTWSRFAVGGTKVVELPGDHDHVLESPALDALASGLAAEVANLLECPAAAT